MLISLFLVIFLTRGSGALLTVSWAAEKTSWPSSEPWVAAYNFWALWPFTITGQNGGTWTEAWTPGQPGLMLGTGWTSLHPGKTMHLTSVYGWMTHLWCLWYLWYLWCQIYNSQVPYWVPKCHRASRALDVQKTRRITIEPQKCLLQLYLLIVTSNAHSLYIESVQTCRWYKRKDTNKVYKLPLFYNRWKKNLV